MNLSVDSMRPYLIVGAGALSHLVLGRWVVSPWLMPDLMLLTVFLAMVHTPGHPIGPALLGGLVAMLSAVHHPLLVGLAYLGAGWLIKWLAARWDLADGAMPWVAVGVAEGMLIAVWLFLATPVTFRLLLLSGVKVLLTIACLPLVKRLVRRRLGTS